MDPRYSSSHSQLQGNNIEDDQCDHADPINQYQLIVRPQYLPPPAQYNADHQPHGGLYNGHGFGPNGTQYGEGAYSGPDHHPRPAARSHARCQKIYLYTQRLPSVRRVARQALEAAVRRGHFDLDLPLQQWALLVGDYYYDAVRDGGPDLKIRCFGYRERARHGWEGERHRKVLLGCTELGQAQMSEKAVDVRASLHRDASNNCQEFVRRLYESVRPYAHQAGNIPHVPWANVKNMVELCQFVTSLK